jgi:DNA-binding transcriptional ArsR family regulator
VFHEKARLGIMTSLLARPEGLTFADLKLLCDLSDGNLNRHLAVLQETEFVEVEKEGAGRSSRTVCHLTRLGQTAFAEYLDELERVIADAAAARKKVAHSAKSLRPGWTPS